MWIWPLTEGTPRAKELGSTALGTGVLAFLSSLPTSGDLFPRPLTPELYGAEQKGFNSLVNQDCSSHLPGTSASCEVVNDIYMSCSGLRRYRLVFLFLWIASMATEFLFWGVRFFLSPVSPRREDIPHTVGNSCSFS